MTSREDIVALLYRRGFTKKPNTDLFYNPDAPGIRYRATRIMLRREHRLESGPWVRACSNYFKNLSISEGDKIAGMRRG